ncbi:hypothetical protein F383_37874 [Gossypium arboreum]|uniref:Uncharacterized protein n=1 Tax=Gossypium arboreum TaxID=29729 RepID=A0A0B0M8Z4_GOSAR|nr:hypothetical protein F383_37874 [Gossypium arboreum]
MPCPRHGLRLTIIIKADACPRHVLH